MGDELLALLAYELGEIYLWEEQCPGVYYLSILPTMGEGGEYYAVLKDAPISQEARAMGRQLEGGPVLVYPLEGEDGAWAAVDYEVLRYRTQHSLPLPEGKSLRVAALYGMEQCPDYFGTYPVPPMTPWGYTLRHRPLDNGIYWMETDQCVEVLAVCHPVWASELPEGLLAIAKGLNDQDEMGYLYFSREDACVVIWEFLRTRSALVSTGLIRKSELMNAIWESHPEYAMGYNAQEQAGLNDTLGLLLYAMGVEDRELEGSLEHMISITPEAGTDYTGFWI